MNRKVPMNAFGFLVLFVVAVTGQVHSPTAAGKPEPAKLEVGVPVERPISGGERHLYRVQLARGEFVKIEATQTNCNILLAMEGPDKTNVFEFKDDSYRDGPEVQTAAVSASGTFFLKVISFESPQQKGNYSVEISEIRTATEKELRNTAGFELTAKLSKIEKGSLTTEQMRQVLGQFEIALEHFRFAENRGWEATILSSIGSTHANLGNWEKAAEFQRQALEIHRSLGQSKDLVFHLSGLGTTYLLGNEPQKALEVLTEAAGIATLSGDAHSESNVLGMIGRVYEDSGDPARALSYYSRSLERAETVFGHKPIAVALNAMGRAEVALGEHQKAIEHLQRSIKLARTASNKRLTAASLGNLARAFLALGDLEQAEGSLAEALEIDQELSDKIGEAGTLRTMSEVRLKSGRTDEAVELLLRSREIYLSVESSRNLAETLLLLAKAYSAKGELTSARESAGQAVKLMETMRTAFRTGDLRDSFSMKLRDFYGVHIEILMRSHAAEPEKDYAALALQASESARARGLLNLLVESNANIREGVDSELLKKETEIRNLLSARLENLTRALTGKVKPDAGRQLKEEIEQIRLAYERVQEQIRVSSPRYAALTQPRTLSLPEIQRTVLDNDSILLEYFLGKTKSYVWVVTRSGSRSVELPSADVIEQASRRFYESLTARNKAVKFETPEERELRIAQADKALERHSRELGRLVLTPIEPLLEGKRLLIVADGALQYIPFAALSVTGPGAGGTDGRARFLVETNEIVSLPSASALAVMRKETGGRSAAARTLAVLADPIFDTTDERFLALTGRNRPRPEKEAQASLALSERKRTRSAGDLNSRDGLDLVRLPFTRREAEMIAAVVPEGQKETWLDFEANRRLAISPELSNYRFVHFATHGFINDDNPELSGLVFSTIDREGKEQDGFLRVGDIYNMKLPAEMVVLSGCRTGLGRAIRGEGIVGMTRAFMYAGAKRVTVSLWDINDEATSRLMTHYYREMFGPKMRKPAAALRQAQLSLIRSRHWNNPYFWATFVLQGEAN